MAPELRERFKRAVRGTPETPGHHHGHREAPPADADRPRDPRHPGRQGAVPVEGAGQGRPPGRRRFRPRRELRARPRPRARVARRAARGPARLGHPGEGRPDRHGAGLGRRRQEGGSHEIDTAVPLAGDPSPRSRGERRDSPGPGQGAARSPARSPVDRAGARRGGGLGVAPQRDRRDGVHRARGASRSIARRSSPPARPASARAPRTWRHGRRARRAGTAPGVSAPPAPSPASSEPQPSLAGTPREAGSRLSRMRQATSGSGGARASACPPRLHPPPRRHQPSKPAPMIINVGTRIEARPDRPRRHGRGLRAGDCHAREGRLRRRPSRHPRRHRARRRGLRDAAGRPRPGRLHGDRQGRPDASASRAGRCSKARWAYEPRSSARAPRAKKGAGTVLGAAASALTLRPRRSGRRAARARRSASLGQTAANDLERPRSRLAAVGQGRARRGRRPDHGLHPARPHGRMNLLLGLPFLVVVWGLLLPLLFLDGAARYLAFLWEQPSRGRWPGREPRRPLLLARAPAVPGAAAPVDGREAEGDA